MSNYCRDCRVKLTEANASPKNLKEGTYYGRFAVWCRSCEKIFKSKSPREKRQYYEDEAKRKQEAGDKAHAAHEQKERDLRDLMRKIVSAGRQQLANQLPDGSDFEDLNGAADFLEAWIDTKELVYRVTI